MLRTLQINEIMKHSTVCKVSECQHLMRVVTGLESYTKWYITQDNSGLQKVCLKFTLVYIDSKE